MDDPDGLVLVLVAPVAEHHGAEAERADVHAGTAEGAVLHRGDATPAAAALRRQRAAAVATVEGRSLRFDEGEAGGGVALGDRVDGDLAIEADADDVVAAGGEVAGHGELLRRRARDAQLALGAAGGGDRLGGGVDGGLVAAGRRVDDDHEAGRSGRLALGGEHEPGHAEHQPGEEKYGEKAGHTFDCNTYDPVLQVWASALSGTPAQRRGGAVELAHDELDRQRPAADLLARHHRRERAEGDRAELLGVGADRGQPRREHAHERQVVEAHHRQVLGDPQAELAGGEIDAAGEDVVVADHGGRQVLDLEQRPRRPAGLVEVESRAGPQALGG